MVVDYRDDPGRAQYGGDLPLPLDVLTFLRQWDAANASPDYLLIGHQLPSTWQEGDPIPLVPAPRRQRERDERLTRQLELTSRLLTAAVGGLLMLALAPLAVGAVGLSTAGGAGLDPVIFGGVRHPELPLVEWSYLCGWEWE